jgi:hypothetical protein
VKNLATTAIVSAVVAALVASGATYAAMKINGHSIVLHSIPLNRIEGKLPRGKRGPAGAPGVPGPTVGSKIDYQEASTYLDPNGDIIGTSCPQGQVAISGGFDVGGDPSGDPEVHVISSEPFGSGWRVTAFPTSSTPPTTYLAVYAICVPAS